MFFLMGGAELILSLAAVRPETAVSKFFTEQMTHAEWHGLTFYDLILPLFLYVAGLSFPYSLHRRRKEGMSDQEITRKVFVRCILLILLGILYNVFRLGFTGHIADVRFVSVLGRLGAAFLIAARIYLHFGWQRALKTAVAITLLYRLAGGVLPALFGVADPYSIGSSPVLQVDRLITPGRLYAGTYDPEGIVATIPSVATVLAGMLSSSYLAPPEEHPASSCADDPGASKYLTRLKRFLLAAAVLLISGSIWSLRCPVNKTLWTGSFVCITAALSMFFFAVFYYLIDVRQHTRCTLFFIVIGMNSVTVYLLQVIVKLRWKIAPFVYRVAWRATPEGREVLVWCAYIAIWWLFLYFLYRRKIFLKV